MSVTVEDLHDESRFTHLQTISYSDIIPFILEYIRRKSGITILFWSLCILFCGIAIIIRIDVGGHYEYRKIITHTLFGSVIFPVLIIPFHEGLHIIPFFLSGARNIRIGMDLSQYMFYVTAHRYVATPTQFKIVTLIPFIIINIASLFLMLWLPGLWKWSFSLFLFIHSTMCAGDFALLNFYHVNRSRKIYTWDDADKKEAYFYAEIG